MAKATTIHAISTSVPATRAIHRYRSAFTDCLIFGYLVAKHFEIAATGALLVADRAATGLLAQLGMFEGEHYIATSNDELEETIQFVIDEGHHRELDEMRSAHSAWSGRSTRPGNGQGSSTPRSTTAKSALTKSQG